MPSFIVHVGQLGPRMSKLKWTSWPCKLVINGVGTGPLDNATIADSLGPRLIEGNTSGVGSPAPPAGGRSIVEAILGFHYLMQSLGTFVQRVIVSDGKTPGDDQGPYKSIILNLEMSNGISGGVGTITPENVAPANQTLNLVKSPVGFGLDPGRQFLRWAVRNDHITSGENDGTMIKQDFIQSYKASVEEAITRSGMRDFFFRPGPYARSFFIGQGRYYNKAEVAANPILKGVLKVVEAIEDMTLIDGKPRQVTRGKRNKPTLQQVAQVLNEAGITYDQAAMAARQNARTVVDTGVRPNLQALDVAFLVEAARLLGTTPEVLKGE